MFIHAILHCRSGEPIQASYMHPYWLHPLLFKANLHTDGNTAYAIVTAVTAVWCVSSVQCNLLPCKGRMPRVMAGSRTPGMGPHTHHQAVVHNNYKLRLVCESNIRVEASIPFDRR